MGTVANLVVRISANTGDFEKSVKGLEHSFDRMGGRLQSIGLKLTTGLTLPIAGAGIAATKFAVDFERATTKLVTLSGVSEGSMRNMQQAILAMAPAVGIGPQALAEALLVVTSTGFEGSTALQILELAAKSSAIGMGDTKDVARALTAAITAYGVENLTAAQAADILHQTVVAGGAEATELAGEIGRVVGVAAQLGVSFAEVGAFIATYTRLGLSAAEATTGLSGALNTILSPSAEARKALAEVGLSADQLRRMVAEEGLGAALSNLLSRLGGNADAIGAVFGNVRALAGVMGTAGVQAEQYRKVLDQIRGTTGSVNTAFEQTRKTVGQQWNELKAQVEVAAIALGQRLLPAVMQLVRAATPVAAMLTAWIGWFANLPQPIQTTVIGLLALAAAVGPVAFAIGTLLKTGAAALGFLRLLAGGATATGGAFALASGPVLAFTAAIAGLAFALPKAVQSLMNLWDIWRRFGTKALLGELGRNVNDDAMSVFKEWRVQDRPRRRGGAAPGPLPQIAPGALAGGAALARMRDEALNASLAMDGFGVSVARSIDPVKGLNGALRETVTMMEAWSTPGGRTGIDNIIDQLPSPNWDPFASIPIPPPPAMAGTVGMGVPAGFPGAVAWDPFASIPPPESMLRRLFGGPEMIGTLIGDGILRGVTSAGPKLLNVLSAIVTGFGNQLGTALSSILQRVLGGGGIGGFFGGILGTILPGIGGLLGPLVSGIAGLFDRNKGRDLVEAFAESVGGFEALSQQLSKLGAQGEQLWIKLTQGVGRNNPEQARAAIAEVTAALQNMPLSLEEQASQAGFQTTAQLQQAAQQAVELWQFMRDSGQYSAEAVQQAWERANQALIASGDSQAIAAQQARDSISALDEQIKALEQSIAMEAPEEVMGVIEQQQRAQLEGLKAQRAEAMATLDEMMQRQTTAIQGAVDRLAQALGVDIPNAAIAGAHAIQDAFNGIKNPWMEGVSADEWLQLIENQPTPDRVAFEAPHLAAGGIVTRPTLAMIGERGPEAVVPLDGGSAGERAVYLSIDGDVFARVVLPLIAREAQRLGVS